LARLGEVLNHTTAPNAITETIRTATPMTSAINHPRSG